MLRRLGLVFSLLTCGAALAAGAEPGPSRPSARPNILWILGDDLGPDLGCYGTPEAHTPNLDRLASEGVRFTHAFTTAPVCSPSRSALHTGMYQTSIGAHHHRSHRDDGYRLPAGVRFVTEYFRERGYFTANVKTPAAGLKVGGKTDYNFRIDQPFDGTDWKERKPGQPFFAQINFFEPHRGAPFPQSRKQLPPSELADPQKVALPPYYPDHPVARDDYANYLDAIALLDRKVGQVLRRLETEGLAENTIVFFFGDNGRCHVRDKQWLYDGGIHIPLIVRWQGHLKPGSVRSDLVSAIDITATSLKLAGIEPPRHLQGQVFLGPDARRRSHIIAARDRCDETVDRIRCVRTDRYKYIRNYYPERPYTQPNEYKLRQYPVLSLMHKLHAEGKLTPEQALFMADRRPAEELYDLRSDPYELKNLAGSREHQAILKELRETLERWEKETGDQGAIPEPNPPTAPQ